MSTAHMEVGVKRVIVVTAAAALVAATVAGPAQAGGSSAEPAAASRYVVLYKEGAAASTAQKAIEAAGGTVEKVNTAVGLATVTTSNAGFVAAIKDNAAIQGVAKDRVIGTAPKANRIAAGARAVNADRAVEKEGRGGGAIKHGRTTKAEPLSDLQWDLKQIRADKAHKYEQGDSKVLVGILDTGVDGTHPDIAPNFNKALSRNFTVDIPTDANGGEVDGPCEEEPDQSCNDANDVDENDHGTHVASSIASPINKLGIAGVAPKVSIVNLRVGQDSGYFFLQPSVDALTYAGDIGVDVVNMSYYIDPWLFNCTDNAADSPEDRLEQATIIAAAQRALNYAHRRGVTLVGAAGNQATDYTKPYTDTGSPNFPSVPGEAPRTRTIAPSCVSMPGEAENVISVSATGISKRKSYYSSYGNGYVDVAAPGGDTYDTPGNTRDVTKATLSAYPTSLAIARGELDANGDPTVDYLVKDCKGSTCAYYQYLQGTSMASPRAAGVAALIVSKYGIRDWRNGGKTLSPALVEARLKSTATKTPCPTPPAFTYTRHLPDGSTATATHLCEGSAASNGFYGKGIVDALRAVGR
ncbi:S8 family serine peptidase [Sphaerisporangium sp. TRM90804]|uniref:S8 family peptidase n=1 Tax=Sphaerisporangium sp. TRM90804 TaxID=3031113 RepID=UPI00244A0D59|nr:S8 family serine peptidase [Sphaerisporangium sp. TRM90804]MDH2430003.1 S8 family serine peptidase [Sphaerisporangium sp. TRM90804]